jgi:hypothetical protein
LSSALCRARQRASKAAGQQLGATPTACGGCEHMLLRRWRPFSGTGCSKGSAGIGWCLALLKVDRGGVEDIEEDFVWKGLSGACQSC